ncbi:Hemin transport system permease protein HmuU [Carnimonas sp. R-84981]|uniref:FecCD family ABC transporter permease n=1 Tax=Carnimonas bestiolae TaxID=3402172 RepID=UPI003EDBCAF1
MARLRGGTLALLLTVLLFAALLLALSLGSVTIAPTALLKLLGAHPPSLEATLVTQLRLPRALNAIAVGGLLGLSGAVMQVLLRNPLADPYVLGVSGGASLAALGAMLLGMGGMLLPLSAFGGALLAMVLVFALATSARGFPTTRLLLTGVVMASGWGALIVLLLALAPSQQLPSMLFWLMGDLSYATTPWPGLAVLVLSLLLLSPWGRTLNVLARGPMQAAALGVAVRPVSWGLYVLASLMTAVAVASAGTIGFVGLITPHLLRLMIGNDQRLLLPASAMAGAILLLVADTLGRSLLAPQQLPAGVVTVLLGVPVFIALLRRSSQ